jgi:hypothetical protein
MDGIEREISDLEARLAFHRRLEAEAEARDLQEGRAREETFHDFLRDLPVGLIVGVVTVDGAELWGRVEAVGADKLRLGETPREPDRAARLRPQRTHDIRLDAVVRVVRTAEEWGR